MKNNPVVKSLAVLTALFMLITAVPAEVFAFDGQEPLIGSETEPAADELETPLVPEDDDHAPQPARAFEQALTAPEADGSYKAAGDSESGTAIETIPSGHYLAGADQGTDSLPFVLEDVLATTPTDSGSCGENVNWAFYESVGLLYISGTGEMTNYTLSSSSPWYAYSNSILFAVVADGVTNIGYYAFYGCTSLTSITIPDSVTSIAAFRGCIGLTSITIPDSVTSIGEDAFYGCTGITSITIPDSVTSIGAWAFSNCTGLTSITIPDSVTRIGGYTFSGCSGLTSITIPDSVTSIGTDAFRNCTGLTSITIPDSVTSIGSSAFRGCTGLTSITIPNSVTRIGLSAFYGCSNLTSITLPFVGATKDDTTQGYFGYVFGASSFSNNQSYVPSNLKKVVINGGSHIQPHAFSNCTGLQSITIPDSVTSIGYETFYGCSGLTSITIPDSVTNIGESAFANCSYLTIYCENTAQPSGWDSDWNISGQPVVWSWNIEYKGLLYSSNGDGTCSVKNIATYPDNDVVIPLISPDGESVTSIGEDAFYGCTGITSITIPDSVTSIGAWAFSNCTGLTSITIPNSVTSIGEDAFRGCTGLTSITIPGSVTSIGVWAFLNCTGLTSITIMEGVTSTGVGAFYGCTGLTNITIPDSVTSIENSAFYGCTGLTNITIPDRVTSIGNGAFYGCTGLTSIMIPGNVTSIGNNTFHNCTGLTSITIPNSVTSIGDSAFYGCTGLTSIMIPDNVTSIGNSAFYGCTGLTSIMIPDNVTSIGNSAFYNCTGLTSIMIPDGMTSIGDSAFFCCFNLTSITIPDSITNIGYNTFCGCTGLTSITIGKSVTSIGERAFFGCSWLTSITIPDGVTSIGSSAFSGCTGLTSITIPDGVTSIGSSAFSGCIGLTSITIPGRVTSIGYGTFYYCSGLTSITIPDSVTSIEDKAFYGCTGLTNITIPDRVTSIGRYAFYNCTGLTSVTIGNSVTSIGERAFYDCVGLTSITIPTSVTSIYYNAFEHVANVVYSGTATGSPWEARAVNGYVENGFVYRDSTKQILRACPITTAGSFTIPSSVTIIGNYAFYLCVDVTDITIPYGVERILDYAFYGCSGLTSITIPSSVTSIGIQSFPPVANVVYAHNYIGSHWGARAINGYEENGLIFEDSTKKSLLACLPSQTGSVTIPSSVTSIGAYAFFNCDSLTSITIPNSVTIIGDSAFGGCTGLTSINIPSSVHTIGTDAFNDVANILYSGSASSISRWGARTLNGYVENNLVYESSTKRVLTACPSTNTGSVTIPSSVTRIGGNAFYNCTDLSCIIVPDSVTSIGLGAFYGCTSLTSVTVPFDGQTKDSRTNYFGSIFGADSFTENDIYIPSNLSTVSISGGNTINNCSFYGCKELTNITISDSVTSIGSNAFRGCTDLTSIDIPASVESIGAGAFANCPHLYKAVIRNPDCAVDPTAFDTSVTKVIQYAAVGKAGDTATWYAYKDDSFKEFQYYSVVIEGKGVLGSELTQEIRNKLPTPYISSLTVSEGITGIPDEAFSNWNLLQRVQLADSVRNIGSGVFNSEMLTSIYFDGGRPLMAADAITLAMNNQLGKLTLHYNADTPRWTYSNIPYRSFVPGVGFSTAEADENSYPLTAFVDYQILDSTWHDENGVCYQVDNDNNTHTAKITGFAGGTARVVIPSTVIYAASEYPVVAIDAAFNDIIGLRTITLPASVTTVTGTPVMDCPDLEYVFFKGAIPSGFTMENTPAYAVIIDGAETNGYGGTVYTASPLTDGIDAQGIVYTVDPAAHTAIVGRLSSGTDNAVNTSGFTGTDAHIPDFVLHNNEVFKVVGFDRCAFYGNKTVQTVTFGRFIGEGQTDEKPGIWDCTFRNMSNLTSITTAAENAFYKSEDGVLFAKTQTYTVKDEDGNEVADVTLNDSVQTNRLMVYPIGKTDAAYTIPGGISVIERYAFAGNPYLRTVNLNGVTVIGSHAFYNVVGLTDIGTGYQLVYVEDSAFENTVLETVSLTPSLVGIGARAFYKTNLKGTISLYDNIGHIGDGAFGRCTQISAFELKTPTAIEAAYVPAYTVLDGVLFARDGEALRLIQYPAQKEPDDPLYDMSDMPVTAIAADAFYGCRYLQEIIMSDETVTVGSYAFADCANLRHVHIGKSYHGSGEGEDGLFSYGLFWSSTALEFISVDNDNNDFCTDNNGVLYAKDKKTLYAYPAGLTRVSYTVPAEVERIYSLAFAENTNIKQVIVAYTGDTFTVGDMAFSNCTSLEEVYWYAGRVPMAGAKIYDGTPVGTFRTYCKSTAHASGWANVSLWQERPVAAFDPAREIHPVDNDSVKTDDYTLVIRDTLAKPVAGVSVFLTYTADGRQYYFDAVSDDNGILSISFESGTIDKTIHVYLSHPDYISCDFDVILDMDMMITYLTMYKKPTVMGISLNGEKDINSHTAVLNLAEYKEVVSYSVEINGQMKEAESVSFFDEETGTEKTVAIKVQGLWDNGFGNPLFRLTQGDNVLADSASGLNASVYGSVCTFIVPLKLLCKETDLSVDMSVTRSDKPEQDPVSCSSILHIQVIDFIVDTEGISISEEPVPLDFAEGSPVLAKLIGDGKSFDLGKHVTFDVSVDGSEVTLTAKVKGSKKLTGYNDYETGYEANHEAHNKNTYFFQFYDAATNCTYNIRFARGTEEFGYYYYRLYVYNGLPGVKYDDKVMLEFGGVSVSAFGVNAGRPGLVAFAAEIYRETRNWVKQKKLEEWMKENDITVENPQGPYVPLRMTYSETGKEGAGVSSGNISFTLEGSLVFEYMSDHSFDLKSGSVTGNVKVTAQNSTQYVVWIIPVTVDVNLTVEGKVELSIKFDGRGKDTHVTWEKLRATLSVELELSAGIGCSVASLGFYGKAGTVIVFDLLPKPASFKDAIYYWEVHGELGLYVKVFGIKRTLRILPWKDNAPAILYIIDNREKRDALHSTNMLSPGALTEYTVRSMLYMSGEWDAQSDCPEMPRLVTIDGTEYVFYMTNVEPSGLYDDYNNMKLVRAEVLRDETTGFVTLGTPVIVEDNGYVDTAFDLYAENGTVYLALTQQTKKMDMISSEDPYALAEGLSIHVFDLSDDTAMLLTAGPAVDGRKQPPYKYLTSITEVNGIPTVVWAQNADNNIFGISPFNEVDYVYSTDDNNEEYVSDIVSDVYSTTANSLWMSRLTDGEWVTECLADGLSPVTELTVAPDGTVYYVLDTDSDLADDSDRALYTVRCGEDPAGYTGTGSVSSVTVNGTDILCYDSKSGLTVLSGSMTVPASTDMLSGGYRLITASDGRAVLLYTESKTRMGKDGIEYTCSVLYGLFRTDEGSAWGAPVAVYDSDTADKYIADIDACFDAEGRLLTVISLCNSDGQNDGLVMSTFDPAAVNLTFSDLIPDYAAGTVSFTVTNGSADTQTVNVNGEAYTVCSGEELTITVKPINGCVSVTDADGAVLKTYENVDLGYADLEVLTKQAAIGDSTLLIIAVRNNGNIDAENVKIYVSRDVSLTWEGMVSSIDESGLAQNAVTVLGPVTIQPGKPVYYEVTLDHSMINDENGVITVYAVPADHDDPTDNVSTRYFGEIEQIKIGKDDTTLSVTDVDLMLNDIADLTVTVLNRAEDGADITVTDLTDEDYTVDNASGRLTIFASYLNTLSTGSHELTVVCGDSTVTLTVNVFDPASSYVVRWILGQNDETGEDEFVCTTVNGGETPVLNRTPKREGYVFAGWEPVETEDGSTVYRAVFEEPAAVYTVTWVYLPGVTQCRNYLDGTALENDTESFNGKEIIGWDMDNDGIADELGTVTCDMELTAVYKAERIRGDVNGDGILSTVDVAMMNAYVRGLLTFDEEQLACADMIGTDGRVTTADVARLNAIVRNNAF